MRLVWLALAQRARTALASPLANQPRSIGRGARGKVGVGGGKLMMMMM